MSVDYHVRKPDNLEKINSNDYGELLWWSYTLSVSPEKILTTIDKVGNSTKEIKKYIQEEVMLQKNAGTEMKQTLVA